ncbi:MAG: sensor histidine kinase [Granulosicoccus sp.]
MNSLERSLQIGMVGSLVILMFIFWWTVTLTSRMLTDSYIFTELERQTYVLQQLFTDDADALDNQLQSRVEHFPGRHYLWSVSNNDALDQALLSITVPDLFPGQSARRAAVGVEGEPLLAWFGGFAIDGESIVLGAVQDISVITEKLRVFQWFAGTLAALLLIVLLTVQRIILRRSVEKLERIRRDMLRLEHGQAVALSEDVPSEIMPLVTEFNQLLRRFEQRLRQSRNAVGNLAHSLKGPLNLLMRSSEASTINEPERLAIAQNAEHIRRLIESELKRARLAGRSAVGKRFDVDAELPAMIGLLEQVYSEKGVNVSYRVDTDVELVHDRQDMLELIGNLLDNAVKWCSTKVELRMRSSDGVIIDVEDDGPGCSPEMLGRLTGRGVRLDESVAGHGLGLSIVKDIVDTYDGRLVLEPSPALGGLKASAYLPRRG